MANSKSSHIKTDHKTPRVHKEISVHFIWINYLKLNGGFEERNFHLSHLFLRAN